MPNKKRKHDNPSLKERLERPWCYYCNKDFDDLRILIDHQKAKHYKCLVHGCNRHLNTAGGLRVHMAQVHKEDVRYVPNALEDRSDIHVEIFGMEGIPPTLIEAHNAAITAKYFESDENRRQYEQEQQAAIAGARSTVNKKPKMESTADIKKRVAEAIARKKAGLPPNPDKAAPGAQSQDAKKDEQSNTHEAQPSHIINGNPASNPATQATTPVTQYPFAPVSMAPGFPPYGHYPMPGMPPVMPGVASPGPGFPPAHLPHGAPLANAYPVPRGVPTPPGYMQYPVVPPPSVSPLAEAPVAHGLPPRPAHVPHHYQQHSSTPREHVSENMREASSYSMAGRNPSHQSWNEAPALPRRTLSPPFPFKYFRDQVPNKPTSVEGVPSSTTPTGTPPQPASAAYHDDSSQPMTVQELIDREEKRANSRLREQNIQQASAPNASSTPATATNGLSSAKSLAASDLSHVVAELSHTVPSTDTLHTSDPTKTLDKSSAPAPATNGVQGSVKKGKSKKSELTKLKLGGGAYSWEEKRAASFGTFNPMTTSLKTTGPTSDAVSGAVDSALS